MKVVLVLPAGTVTLAGTVAAAVLPLVSVTTAPPEGAASFKVTVPVEDVPEESGTMDSTSPTTPRAEPPSGWRSGCCPNKSR